MPNDQLPPVAPMDYLTLRDGHMGIKVRGLTNVLSLFNAGALKAEQALEAAVKIAGFIVRKRAREILMEEVYSKERPAWEKALTGDLWDKFMVTVEEVGRGVARGQVNNLSEHARVVEEGSAAHTISASGGGRLEIRGPDGSRFPQSVEHPGTHGIHFLQRALEDSYPEILEVFRKAFRSDHLFAGGLTSFGLYGYEEGFDGEGAVTPGPALAHLDAEDAGVVAAHERPKMELFGHPDNPNEPLHFSGEESYMYRKKADAPMGAIHTTHPQFFERRRFDAAHADAPWEDVPH